MVWVGLMTLSPAAWVFILWTVANLLPRAISHHRWYQENFPDYPITRLPEKQKSGHTVCSLASME